MAFTVEDGSGIAGANSYLSVAEADTYHADRGNSAWGEASTAAKQSALIRATQFLEARYEWATGVKADQDNGLGWPRYEAYDKNDDAYDYDEVPIEVKQATAELALRSLSAELVEDEERVTQSETVGPISVTYADKELQKRYPLIEGILKGLISVPGRDGFVDVERG